MNRQMLMVMTFGLVFAGGSSVLIYRVMMNRMAGGAAAADSHPVCIAARDVEPGTVLRDEDVTVAPWFGQTPATAILKKGDAVGRTVAVRLHHNEMLLADRLAAAGAGAGLAAMIPSGMRAVAVRVNDVVGVAGFAVPGTHVDVIASASQALNAATASAGSVSRTILQDITVLSAGQDLKQDSDGKAVSVGVVNLLVTPQQAEILSLAGSQTTIQLVLRNGLDKEKVPTTGVALNGLLGDAPPAPVSVLAAVAHQPRAEAPAHPRIPAAVTAAEAVRILKIQVIAGTKMTEVGVPPGSPISPAPIEEAQ